MYAKFIVGLQIVVVISFFVSLVGMVVCGNSRALHLLFTGIAALDIFMAAALVVEYVVRSYLESRPKGLQKYQFSMFEMFAWTAVFAILLGCYKIMGNVVWFVGFIALAILAIVLETRRYNAAARLPKPAQHYPASLPSAPNDATAESESKPNENESA
jgi:hypothetical protein